MKTADIKIKDFELVGYSGGNYTFDYEDSFKWGATSRRAYARIERLINKISYKGSKWRIYAWCDNSGFGYWMLKQREMNYVVLTVHIKGEFISTPTIKSINKALERAKVKIEKIITGMDELPDE